MKKNYINFSIIVSNTQRSIEYLRQLRINNLIPNYIIHLDNKKKYYEKYFKDFKSEIRNLFSPTKEIVEYINSKYGNILENSVAIHSRRGDYTRHPNLHPICNMDYYNSAIEHFGHRKNFLVFGDDVNWLRDNFDANFHIIQETDVIDLYIMSMCTDNIIANSSFSWWGAWLNPNENKKVIAPKNWFGSALSGHNTKDLLPDSWITI